MEKIKKKYADAVGKLTDRIALLEERNGQLEEELAVLDASYRSSVIADDGQADKIKRQVVEKQKETDDCEDQINVLRESMSVARKKAANVAAREYAKERDRQAAAGGKACDAIRKAKEAYIVSVAKAQRADRELTDKRIDTRFILKHADESLINELGLDIDRDGPADRLESFFNLHEHLINHVEVQDELMNTKRFI